MAKIIFNGGKLTNPNKAMCNKNLTIVLKAERFIHTTGDYKVEMVCKGFRIMSIIAIAKDAATLDRLEKILAEHRDVIVPSYLRFSNLAVSKSLAIPQLPGQ